MVSVFTMWHQPTLMKGNIMKPRIVDFLLNNHAFFPIAGLAVLALALATTSLFLVFISGVIAYGSPFFYVYLLDTKEKLARARHPQRVQDRSPRTWPPLTERGSMSGQIPTGKAAKRLCPSQSPAFLTQLFRSARTTPDVAVPSPARRQAPPTRQSIR